MGYIAKAGRTFLTRKGVKEGDLVFLEHYLPCMKCEWCHQGEYRHCEAADWNHNPNAIRYGYTSADHAPPSPELPPSAKLIVQISTSIGTPCSTVK